MKKKSAKPRTTSEIKRQIDGLAKMRKSLPRTNFFGDDNWDSIDAQIETLQGKNPFIKSDAVYMEVERAKEWMAGRENEDLFE